jgi:hypothetical protein
MRPLMQEGTVRAIPVGSRSSHCRSLRSDSYFGAQRGVAHKAHRDRVLSRSDAIDPKSASGACRGLPAPEEDVRADQGCARAVTNSAGDRLQ